LIEYQSLPKVDNHFNKMMKSTSLLTSAVWINNGLPGYRVATGIVIIVAATSGYWPLLQESITNALPIASEPPVATTQFYLQILTYT
jgi:hypothetical protein